MLTLIETEFLLRFLQISDPMLPARQQHQIHEVRETYA